MFVYIRSAAFVIVVTQNYSSSAVQKRHNKVYGKLSPPPSIQFSLSMTTLIRQRFKRITVVNQICRSLIIEESQTCLQPRYNGGDPGITLNCFPPSAITLWLGQVPDDPYILWRKKHSSLNRNLITPLLSFRLISKLNKYRICKGISIVGARGCQTQTQIF